MLENSSESEEVTLRFIVISSQHSNLRDVMDIEIQLSPNNGRLPAR